MGQIMPSAGAVQRIALAGMSFVLSIRPRRATGCTERDYDAKVVRGSAR